MVDNIGYNDGDICMSEHILRKCNKCGTIVTGNLLCPMCDNPTTYYKTIYDSYEGEL